MHCSSADALRLRHPIIPSPPLRLVGLELFALMLLSDVGSPVEHAYVLVPYWKEGGW